MRILVTGSRGMIGSCLVQALLKQGHEVIGVDRAEAAAAEAQYQYCRADLGDLNALTDIIDKQQVDRVIHLAALAHTGGENDLSWERYYHVNVTCAKNVFQAAGDRPVLYISTVDVFGFFSGGVVTADTPLKPVSHYGRSKMLAEEECRKLPHYTIFRLSPVYTPEIKRDIQKRYYLKYPSIAYRVGKGTEFEILNIDNAVRAMVEWCDQDTRNDVQIIKDPVRMNTADYIRAEKEAGRASFVLYLPRWLVNLGYTVLYKLLGENEKTYLLNKAVHPLRSE